MLAEKKDWHGLGSVPVLQSGYSILFNGYPILVHLCKIKPVEVHNLVPCRNKIIYKFLVAIGTAVDLCNCPEL